MCASSASPPMLEEASDTAGLSAGIVSGGLSKTMEFRFVFGAGGLATNVASSNGLHLKSFLYPPHVTLLL